MTSPTITAAPANKTFQIDTDQQRYIDIMRGLSILRVVLGHLGLIWFYPPYSQYIGIFFPVLFFVSGAVSFYSLTRSVGIGEYLIKRLVLIITPFYLFAILTLIAGVSFFDIREVGFAAILRWLLIWPDFKTAFFPLQQVWFINALVVMVIASAPLFLIAQTRPRILWVGVVGPCVLSLINFAFPFYGRFTSLPAMTSIGYGWQGWQIMTLFGTFVAGALHYRLYQHVSPCRCAMVAATSLVGAVLLFFAAGLDFELSQHVRQRSPYFLLLSFFAIYLLLAARPIIVRLLDWMPFVRWFILYFNNYAYAIFLLHTLVLFAVEEWGGMTDLGGRPALAVVRLVVVLVITLICAKPLGDVSSWAAHWIRRQLLVLLVNKKPASSA